MAGKKSANPVKTYNIELLKKINEATDSGGFLYVSKENGLDLANDGLIVVNTSMLNEAGDAASKITEKGKVMLNTTAPQTENTVATPAASPYAILNGVQLPASKRGNKGGGAPVQYPFETMEIGQSFFVPVSEKHKDPVKTLGSTVSNANMRFADKTGEMKTVTRTKRGEKNRAVVDPATGEKVKETVQVPVYKQTRRFSIRPVKAGVVYGDWTAPADGAVIARVALKD